LEAASFDSGVLGQSLDGGAGSNDRDHEAIHVECFAVVMPRCENEVVYGEKDWRRKFAMIVARINEDRKRRP
jgi:hypothetical protein